MTATANPAEPNRTPAAAPTVSGRHRELSPASVLTVIGCCCVLLGGLVAAVAEPLDLARGSWVAAYLVLVGGVAQCAMGHARAWSAAAAQPRRWGWVQIGAWNLGNAVVIGGTLAGRAPVVDLGAVLLVVAVAIALPSKRSRAAPPPNSTTITPVPPSPIPKRTPVFGTPTHPIKVQVTGMVLADQHVRVVMCPPFPDGGLAYTSPLPPTPRCLQGKPVIGVDMARITLPEHNSTHRWGRAHIGGTWDGNRLMTTSQRLPADTDRSDDL